MREIMSDDEEYRSSEDEEYVPTDGEEVSEEEHSGEEENLDALKEDGEPVPLGKRKRKSSKKSPKKTSGPRKRTGGIKLEGDSTTPTEETEGVNKELEEQIKLEQEKKKEEQEKKRADDLWSSFMSDVGKPPPKKTSSGLGSLCSVRKPATTENKTPVTTSQPTSTASPAQSKITVTKVYDFAGESVKVTKELDVNSKEGKAELKRQQEEETQKDSPVNKTNAIGSSGVKRSSGGLGGVLEKINKKPKMGTLEKSKLDWEQFKEKEGIDEELKIHNRGKESYIERMHFLQRTDVRQFEIEKNLRLSSSSKR